MLMFVYVYDNLFLASFVQCYKVCVEFGMQTSLQAYQNKVSLLLLLLFSKDVICICKENLSVDQLLLKCQLMKFFLPPDWSP